MSSAARRAPISVGVWLAFMLACCRALALDPSLNVSQYAHTAWRVRDGFAKGEINAIAQTPDGYLWLGTEFGLLRFDGVRAVPWQPPLNQHLPSSVVFCLLTSQDGTLWIGTDKGLATWKEGQLTTLVELAGQSVTDLLQDREGSIWVGTYAIPNGKLCAIRNAGAVCYGKDGEFGDGVFVLYEDRSHALWAGVRTGLWRWKPGPPKFYRLVEPEGIRALGEDDRGALLIGIGGGIAQFLNGRTVRYPLARGLMQFKANVKLLRDHSGSLWSGTADRGIVHIHDRKTDLYTQADNLSGDYVNSIFEDREGNIWVATRGGLDRFRDFAVATLSVGQGLSNDLMTTLLASIDGSVWMGSAVGGLNLWRKGQITTFGEREPGKARIGARTNRSTLDGKLNGAAPNALFQDHMGRIWVSTQRGVGYLDDDRFIPVPGVPGGQIPAMADDTDGNLWIAHQDFGLFQTADGRVVRQIHWTALGHKDPAMTLTSDPQGGLWLGFLDGGVAYFKDGQVRMSYAAADGLAEGRVTGLQLDEDGTLWVTAAGGISRLKEGRLATLTSRNGLPCDMVHGALRDDEHSLWLYMPCGLVRISVSELDGWYAATDKGKDSKPTIHAMVFGISDGVRSHATAYFYSPSVAKSLDGRLWFLPTDGVSVLDPRHLPFTKQPPPVDIEQITADHKTYDVSQGLHLPPRTRDLEIDYTALSMVIPEKNRFRVKLEGYDRDWQDVGNRRQAFYTNLTPRNYRFLVKACNNSGVWNEEGAAVDFTILPAYYQTNWFRGVCMAAFLALLWAVYQVRLHQLRQRFNAGFEARVGERTRIARELHDTLLQNLHGLLFRFQAARNMLPRRTEEAMEALDGAISRTEQAIAESRDTIKDLRYERLTSTDLAELLTQTGRELESGAVANGNLPIFRVIVEGEPQTLSFALQDEVYGIARELLRNAFQHSRAHHIEAEIRYDSHLLRVLIRDDGKGMDPKVLKEGGKPGHWGLPGVRERAKQIGARLHFWSEAGAGTEVQLTVSKKPRDGSKFRLFRKM